jgi:predicted ATPase/DNA-binding CsgD family transcriptional regulator
MTDPNTGDPAGELTDRERAILQLIAEGHTNRDIATALTLSPYTVNWYVQQIFGKLGVNRRTQAVATARAQGLLVDTPDPGPPLPVPLTPLIGRERELDTLNGQLDDEAIRLVTILGPGGIGKTRLALAVAASQQEQGGKPAYFVPLEGIAAAEHVVRAVADAIGFRFQGSPDLQRELLHGLRNRQALLVLDNFEHVLEAAPLVVDMLVASPGLTVLATSRERLNLHAETVYTLEGLAYPRDIERLEDFGAVQLFVRAARRALPDFALRGEDWPHTAKICRLVEGMPLALELAAGWVGLLSPQEIARELEHGLELLRSQAHDLPDRHHSMRLVFEHSWRLLTDDERSAFKKLVVFRGRFDRAAAEAVAGASLSMLGQLYDKSLLGRRGENRYRLHELVRQFAEEKLGEDPEEYRRTLDDHARHYGRLVQAYESESRTNLASNTELILAVQRDSEDILAGWTRAVEELLIDEIGRYIYTLAIYFSQNSFNLYAEESLRKALHQIERHLDQVSAPIRMMVLAYHGWFTGALGRYEEGRRNLEEALAMSQALETDHQADMGILMMALAWMTYATGDTALARRRAGEALERSLDAGFGYGELVCLFNLGNIEYEEANYAQARRHYGEGLALCERNQYLGGIVWTLPIMGCAFCAIGDVEQGVETFRRVLEILKTNPRIQIVEPQLLALVGIAALAEREGTPEEALVPLAIVRHHPRCGPGALFTTLHHLEKLRASVPPEQYEAVMREAERGELSHGYLTSEFAVGPELVDWLLAELDAIEIAAAD